MGTTACKHDGNLLPEQLNEQLETLHFPALGAVLNVFAQQQASSTFAKTLRRPQCRLLRQQQAQQHRFVGLAVTSAYAS